MIGHFILYANLLPALDGPHQQIRGGSEPLDATLVHPEDYATAKRIFSAVNEKATASPPPLLTSDRFSGSAADSCDTSSSVIRLHALAQRASAVESIGAARKLVPQWFDSIVEAVASCTTPLPSLASPLSAGSQEKEKRQHVRQILIFLLSSGVDPRLHLHRRNDVSGDDVVGGGSSVMSDPSSIGGSSSVIATGTPLAPSLCASLSALAAACPLRGVRGIVANVVTPSCSLQKLYLFCTL